tara:strand:- start:2866 stop:3420 length:555 start_codon:yes stop_codon:yes gene_type:complete
VIIYLCRSEFGDAAERSKMTVFKRMIGPIAVAAFLLNSCSAEAEAPIVAAGEQFQCTPIAVWDGDGPVWCREGMKIRLAGIAAREIDGSCRPDHPCPVASGIKARDRLVSLFGGAKGSHKQGHVIVSAPAMQCLSAGSGKGDRTAAWCLLADGRNVSCEMITSGTVLRWKTYDLENVCGRKKRP